MEKNLIASLLRVYHSDKPRQHASKVLIQFIETYNIGQRIGASLAFSAADRETIRALLLAEERIDAATTTHDQWDDLSRTESLELGSNEKLTDAPVRPDRVAVKALPGKSLLLDRQSITLPLGANLDLDWRWMGAHCGHASVLLVENWEAFDRIHQATFDLSRAGENPLVVFRGSPVYRQDYAMSLLHGLALPVFAFVDYDPSGLVIAQRLPHFAGLITPPTDQLQTALTASSNHHRYRSQLPQAQAVLNAAQHPEIIAHWRLLQIHGKALPQEYFLMERH
ncbi:MAG: DUF7281 domain-containing protein [Burkholderiaceae bacterium]